MFVYNGKTRTVFAAVIVVILFVGIVGGIVVGLSLRGPSAETRANLTAATEEYSRYYWNRDKYDQALEQFVAEENRWGMESTVAMVSIWVVSVLLAVFGYGFVLIIELLDEIRLSNVMNESNKFEESASFESEHKGYSLQELANNTTDNNSSWVCRNCGAKNTTNDVCCKDCGKYK